MTEQQLLRRLSTYGATIQDREFIPPDGLKGFTWEHIVRLADLATYAEDAGYIDPRPSLREMLEAI